MKIIFAREKIQRNDLFFIDDFFPSFFLPESWVELYVLNERRRERKKAGEKWKIKQCANGRVSALLVVYRYFYLYTRALNSPFL